MAQKRRGAETPPGVRASRWVGLALLALGLFLLAALLTYSPLRYRAAVQGNAVFFRPLAERVVAFAASGRGLSSGPLAGLYHNAGGGFGLWLGAVFLKLLGWVGVWFVPLLVGGWGWNRLRGNPVRRLLWRTGVGLPLLVVLDTAAAVPGRGWGGALGDEVWGPVRGAVGPVGGALLLLLAVVGFFVLEAEAWTGRWGEFFRRLGRWTWGGLTAGLRGLGRVLGALGRAVAAGVRGLASSAAKKEAAPPVEEPPLATAPVGPEPASAEPRIVDSEEGEATEPMPPPPAARPVQEPKPVEEAPRSVEEAVAEARRRARQGKKKTRSMLAAARGRMVLPTTEILDDVPEAGPPVAEEELLDNSRTLTETLQDFGISGRVGEVHPGPIITRYEYVPGPGVKVSQILHRQDDLALKLRARRIRIIAPIPGKAAVGIEVPNRNPAPIFLRRLLETRAYREASGPLPLALGRDIGGAPVIAELSRMPHLLIAGTTGSGKSVCMNALITSLLLKRTPAELRLLMVDPKMLELPMYNGIPHLLTEVVTDPKVAARSLKWLLLEMERRYRTLAARGSRSIQSYNALLDREGPKEEGEEKLPYIVVLVDELADLMVTSGKEVEEPIGRLAQTARAVGIHLVIATQRPSVDVVTGVIKANFPARIAFQVASRTDSRTILDQNGAESLLGRGDMLFLPPGQAVPQRVHGAFVSESETQRLADAWREQGRPENYAGLEEALTEPESALGGIGEDALFEDAARLVVAAGQASASMLQRRLKVGYARAARLVDMLESAGVVSPQEGSKAREVLVDQVRLEHVLAGRDD